MYFLQILIMFIFVFILTLCHNSISQQLFGLQSINVEIAPNIEILKQLGVEIVRLPTSWRLIEATGKGQYQSWVLDNLDKQVQALTEANIKIIIQMAQTPCWASTSSNCTQFYYRPKNYEDYADAMVFLLNRYGNKIYAWEVWNEPNMAGSWLRPECQSNHGLCPRAASQNDDWMDYIDLVAAQEYSAMVKITYQKMKTISPDVIVLAGSLAGSDIGYLDEMYTSGIKDNFTALAMHPYTSPYPVGTNEYGREYGPDECFLSTRASNFWCFKRGVERVRDYMIQQGDSSKSIWFTEFGFSSYDGWNGAGLQGQANHLERAIDLIQTQWSFVQVASVHELSDDQSRVGREGSFGLVDKNLQIKPSGSIFIKKVKNNSTVIPIIIEPVLFPYDLINVTEPYFSWPSLPYVGTYHLWVNDYSVGSSTVERIDNYYSPSEANCPLSNGQYCKVTPNVGFKAGQWWLTATFVDDKADHVIVDGLLFSVQ